MMPKKSSGKGGLGCLFLFALPFAGVGVGVLCMVIWSCLQYVTMRHWEEVPARIVRTELKEHHGDDSTSYEATAEYTYTYRGRAFTGNRVSLHSGGDNIGSYQQDVYRELQQYRNSQKPFRCYVNPDQPAESILYRDLRWEMIGFYTLFVLMFGGVGFGLLIGSIYAYRKSRSDQARAAANPEEPWLWRDDWAKGEIRSSNKGLLVGAWIFAVLWNLVSLPACIALPGEILHKGNRLALVGLLFPAVGLGLLAFAAYLLLRWRKYGDSVFQMASVPGVIGGKLAGVVRTSARLRPEKGFRLTLSCIHKYSSGSGKNHSSHESILWQDQRVIARGLAEADCSQTSVPVLFGIPYDARPSDSQNSDDQTIWRLEIAADVPGIDYATTFEVPVFKTAESQPDFKLDASPLAAYAAPVDPEAQLQAAGVIRTVAPDGSARYVFPMARQWRAALGLTLFAILWNGAIAVMLRFEAPIFFPIVFGLFDLLVLYILADLWFYRSVVDVSPRGLTIRAGLFGLGESRRLELADIAKFEFAGGMQAGNTVYFDVKVRLQNQKKLTAAKLLPSRALAEGLIARWEDEMTK
jgi:hypothetical protein